MWAAAGDGQQRRQAKQAVTGRCVATDARHGIPLTAANLVNSGERYAYALHLLSKLLPGCEQAHIDIMCKWGPWADKLVDALRGPRADIQVPQGRDETDADYQQRVDSLDQRIEELRELLTASPSFSQMRKVLSHAHGTLHATACQVLWQPSWTVGCAKTLGEEGEQLFSYLSQWSFTSRNQSVAASSDNLFKAVAHFGREKIRQQAAYLVNRLTKYKEQLAPAQQKLRDAMLPGMQDMTADQQQQLVQQLRQALQEWASDEVNARRNEQQQLLKRFADAVAARDTQALRAFVNNSLAGWSQQQLAAARIIAGLTSAEVVQLHDLANRLCASADASSADAARADNEDFLPALNAGIIRLQNMIEGTCHDLSKKELKRDATAATPKERQRYSKKCASLAADLKQRVEQYNQLVVQYNAARLIAPLPQYAARAEVVLEDVRSHRFGWVDEYTADEDNVLRQYGVARSMALVEAHNEVQRIKEELSLLQCEMRTHVGFWEGKLAALQQMQAVLDTTATGQMPTEQQLQDAGYTMLVGQGRYQPPASAVVADTAVCSGMRSLVCMAVHEVRGHLAVARKHFAAAGVQFDIAGPAPAGSRAASDDDIDSEDGDAPPPV